jgi:phosphotransacetylase
LFKIALLSASTFSQGDDNKDLRVKNADNAVLQSGK